MIIKFFIFIFIAFSLSLSFASDIQGLKPGIDYETISPSLSKTSPENIEVRYVFSYGCNHCKDFEPLIRNWTDSLPAYVDYMPMPFTPYIDESVMPKGKPHLWSIYTRLYYTADLLGLLPSSSQLIFETIHDKKQKINTEEQIVSFLTTLKGAQSAQVYQAFHSFIVKTKIDSANNFTQSFLQNTSEAGIPCIIINGKYYVRPKNNTYQKVIDVANKIIDHEHDLMIK